MIGKGVKAAAENSDQARLSGINPKLISLLVWTIGGFLATLSMILIAGQANSSGTLAALGPSTLVRALAAAVIGGMVSFPIALIAGIGIGIAEAVVRFNFLADAGLIDFLLFLAVLVAVWLQSRQPGETQAFVRAQGQGGARTAPEGGATPQRADTRCARHRGAVADHRDPALASTRVRQHRRFAVCGLSVTVLTGWAGQLSLGQMAFAVSARCSPRHSRGFALGIGWRTTSSSTSCPLDAITARHRISTLLVAGLAALIGLGATSAGCCSR
jgi:ABC-type branched-subunit amino acid transport system permease subunit